MLDRDHDEMTAQQRSTSRLNTCYAILVILVFHRSRISSAQQEAAATVSQRHTAL